MENIIANAIILKNQHTSLREFLNYRLPFYLIITLLCTSACKHDKPAEPACRKVSSLASDTIDSTTMIPLSKHSACLIRLNNQVLSIQYQRSDKLDVPGGTVNQNENAQCAAHRHTWKTTGFNVEVGRYLGSDEMDTQYFQCRLAGNFIGEIQEFPVPQWSQSKVSSIQLIDPFSLQNKDWQGENRLILVRDMFNSIED
jgi:hypothetical protein